MVDDLKPRYTTKRLRQEIERARENDARHIAALEAKLAERVKEVSRLQQALVRYGDRTRMAWAPSDLQQTIDDALSALETTPPEPKVTDARTWGEIPNARTDDAHPVNVLAGVLLCAESWVPEARIIGNVRAGDLARSIRAFEPSALAALTAAQEAGKP